YMGNGAGAGWTLAGVIRTGAAATAASDDGSATWTAGASVTAGRVLGVVLAAVVVRTAFAGGAAAPAAGTAGATGGAACEGAAAGGVTCGGVAPALGSGE